MSNTAGPRFKPKKPSQLTLWAVCESLSERLKLGRATRKSSDVTRETLLSEVLIHHMFWAGWRGKRVTIVTDADRMLEALTDVTDAAISTFVVKYQSDETVRRVFKKNPSPEIVLQPEQFEVTQRWQ